MTGGFPHQCAHWFGMTRILKRGLLYERFPHQERELVRNDMFIDLWPAVRAESGLFPYRKFIIYQSPMISL